MTKKATLLFAWVFLLLSIGAVAQPLNDDCTSASPITLPSSGFICVAGTLAGATDDGQFSTCENLGSKEVWFTYIATGSNNVIVATPTGASPASDLVVNVTNSSCLINSLNTCNAAATPGGAATASWGYTPGSQVWVSVSSNSGSGGTFELCVASITVPLSDGKDCSTAVPICNLNSFVAPVNFGANGFLPPCFTTALQQPIIFKFTVGQGGLLNWLATPSCGAPNATTTEFDWAVYDITNGCPGTAVACNFNYTASGFFFLPTTCPQGMQGGPAAGCNRTTITGLTSQEICPGVTVTAGRTYAIILDQYTAGSTCSLNFDFTGSTFQLAPTSEFTVTPATGCDNVNVTFNNTSVASTSYSWTFGDGTTSAAQNPPAKTYSTEGTYLVSLTTTSASGCTSVASRSVQVVPSPVLTLTDTMICPGTSAILTASPDITGGTYSWSPGAQTTQVISVSPGSNTAYTVTYNLLGCTASASATVNIAPVAFTVNAGNDTAICNGGSALLNGSVQPSGSYTYLWTPGGTLSGANTLTPTATTSAHTTYTLSVTDAMGCSKTDAVQVNVNPIPTVTASVNPSTICPGELVQLNAVINPAPTSISWTPTSGANVVSNPTIANPTAAPVSPQRYVVTALNNGCAASDSVMVIVDTVRVDAGADRATCSGSGTTLTATVIGTISPGPATFSWTTLSGTNMGSGASVSVNPASATTYVVTMNGGTCVRMDTVLVSIGNLTPTATATDATCNGAANGKVMVRIASTPPFTFAWSANSNTGNVDSAINLPVGSYQVTVTDGSGCSGTAAASVAEPSALGFTNSVTPVSCFGGNDGAISVSPSGGTGAYSYAWSIPQSGSTVSSLSAGSYLVTVSDANGCTSSASIPVNEPSAPLSFTNTAVTNLPCSGSGNGVVTVNVSGGTPTYSYSWSHNTNLNNSSAVGLSAAVYTVTVRDANNCTATETNTVTEPAPITFSAPDIINATCNGATNGSIEINPIGGVGSYTYTWNGTPGSNPRTNIGGGTYAVVVTDANGCTASTTASINQPSAINVTTSITDVSCYLSSDGSVSLSVTGGQSPYNYNWAGLGSVKDINSLTGGTYNCTVTDNNGCSVGVTAVVNEPLPLSMDLQSTGINCTDDLNGTISVFPSGGTVPYSYSATLDWSIFFYTQGITIEGLATGLYTVILADENGCIFTDTITVTDALADEFIFSTDSTSCFGDEYQDGAIYAIETSIDNRPYQYSLDGGELQFSGDFFGLSAGTHTLVAVSKFGCETTHTIVVPEPVDAFAAILPSDTVVQLGESVSLETVFGPGGTSSISSYNWSPSLGLNCMDCPNPVATPYNRDNEYSLLIIYNEICTVSASVSIQIDSRPEVFIPNSFSPNGDGNNDVFQVYGAAIKTVDLKIFNRWGELVYKSNNQFNGWDGIYRGQMQGPGVYTFQVLITYLDDKQFERNGSFTLLK